MRLDILIYAHDGRGLGHISRTVGIGLALRRMYPGLRILLVSGSGFTRELVGNAPLDWIKLPSYKTEVVDGKSLGVDGDSGFTDKELGRLRSQDLTHIVGRYRPKLVLVDHSPRGKHRELLEALDVAKGATMWILGVRGVVGDVGQVQGRDVSEIYKRYYSGLLWYGDSRILGTDHCLQLQEQYGDVVVECGYVSRLQEYLHFNKKDVRKKPWAGVVSVPWLGEKSIVFLKCLAAALDKVPRDFGPWCLYIGGSDGGGAGIGNLFTHLPHCELLEPGGGYGHDLMNARSALVYGGYNSLMDVLLAQVPTLVLLREMQDNEQQVHVAALVQQMGEMLTSLSENDVDSDALAELLVKNLDKTKVEADAIKIDGATSAATYLYSRLQEC